MHENYLKSVHKQFKYYKYLGEGTFEQLEDNKLFQPLNPSGNSIAIIVNHLSGNMKSRWTNFLTSDGEKEWRERDREFQDEIKSRKELLEKWCEGWHCLFTALESVNEENITSEIYIRNQGHTVVEAINRQLTHYSYHVGQIVLMGKTFKGEKWQSLSIPKDTSDSFNSQKFSKRRRTKHFTDDYLDENAD